MRLKNAFFLFLAAFIWGTAFVAQSVGMDYVGPFTFNGIRSLIGSFFLFTVIMGRKLLSIRRKSVSGGNPGKGDGFREKGQGEKEAPEDKKTLWAGGICCGLVLMAASTLQQVGIVYTTAGKAGFVTALYIIFVPIAGIFLKKKAGIKLWFSVGIAGTGLYLLCMKESFLLQKGDFLVFLCAIAFAGHILVIDYFSPRVDGVKLSCIQFLVNGVISSVLMLMFEEVRLDAVLQTAWPIFYAGVFSCGIAYTCQIVGQKGMNPTIAALIMSLESVISVIADFLILHQSLSVRELAGCLLMFAAIILAQLPSGKRQGIREISGTSSLE